MIPGDFSDGVTSRLTAAWLDVADDAFVVTDESGRTLAMADRSEVAVSSRIGQTPRTIMFPAGEQFSAPDNDAVDDLLSEHFGHFGLLHLLETHLVAVGLSVVIAIAAVAWLVMDGIPRGAKLVAESLPQDVVDVVGAGSIDILDRTLFAPTELPAAELDRVTALLAPVLEAHADLSPSLHFRAGSPNAFALPDGAIVLTDGLVRLLENEAELIAVTYHELGHIRHRHLLRRTLQGSAVTVLVFLVTGDLGNIDIIVGLPTLLLDLAYTRDFELEADAFALDAMAADGVPLTHFADMMNRLAGYYAERQDEKPESGVDVLGGYLEYLSTHPPTRERVALVERFVTGSD